MSLVSTSRIDCTMGFKSIQRFLCNQWSSPRWDSVPNAFNINVDGLSDILNNLTIGVFFLIDEFY